MCLLLSAGMQCLGSVYKSWIVPVVWPHLLGTPRKRKSFTLLDNEEHRVVVSKVVLSDEIAEWSPRLEISGSKGSIGNSIHHIA